jgi:hypothetical protein
MSFIVSVHTKQNLELPWAVQNATSTQPLWELVQVTQGFHRIVYKASGQDLVVTTDENLTLDNSGGESFNSHWRVGQTGGSSVVFESRSANKLLQVDDAGVLSLGLPQYSATQYWTIEPVEGEPYIPEQQPMVTEVPMHMEPIIHYPNVGIAAKRANILRIVILVVSVLMLLGGIAGTILAAINMINPPSIDSEAGIAVQLSPQDFLIDLGSALFTLTGAIIGIASTMNSVKRSIQYKLIYAFISFLVIRVILAVVLEIVAAEEYSQFVEIFGSMAAVLAVQWGLFALCIITPTLACVACAVFRVKYMKQSDQTHIQQVDDRIEVEMQNV